MVGVQKMPHIKFALTNQMLSLGALVLHALFYQSTYLCWIAGSLDRWIAFAPKSKALL